ncbi:MAG: hypothetical protein IJZ53_01315 [Tyzzerella sp.]|nr:hypothetical protein [Tyzzerella sp.]
MMKVKKDSPISKIVALILAVALVVGILPTTTYAVAYSYGTVQAISEGIEVSGDSEVIVTNSDIVTLEWSAADTSIGRTKDGWWVGIKVIAPSGMTETELEGVQYQKKSYGDTVWTGPLSFWSNKDSEAGDSEHHMELWAHLNNEKLNSARATGKTIDTQWQFDWDKDDTYEQTVTISIDPKKVVLNKSGVQEYPKYAAVKAYNGGTVTGSETKNVSVTEDALTLKWSAADTTIGRNEDGWWAGIEVKAPSGMSEAELKNSQYQRMSYGTTDWSTSRCFWTNKDSAEGASEHYIGIWVRLTPAILKEAKDASENIETQLQFDWDNDSTFEQLITFTIVPSDNIVLKKENQGTLTFDDVPNTLTYSTEPLKISVSGGSGTGDYTFTITEGTDVASVATDGTLTLNKAGKFILKASRLGDDTYNEATAITKEIEVLPAEQTGFKFTTEAPENITYNDNGNKFLNAVTGGQSSNAAVYEIVEGGDVADINASTGELTIKKAGTVKVKATKAADDKYKVTSAEYSVTIKKADQAIEFENGAEISVYYGKQTYTNVANPVGEKYGTAAISYEIVGENPLDASVDSTGVVSLQNGKIGTITVKATKPSDDSYNECSAEYTLKVDNLETPTQPYTLSGDTKNESGWYTGDVTITAPEGYEISYSNAITGNTWAESVTVEKEGTNNVSVYLRDENGAITDAIAISDIKIDKTVPKDLVISCATPTWKKILEKISFGIYEAPVTVTLTAADDISGITKFVYTYKNTGKEFTVDAADLTINEKSASYEFTIEPQFRDTITFTVEDVAGHNQNIVDKDEDENEKVIVIDTVTPELTVDYDGVYTTTNNIIYTQDDITIKFAIEEVNFDLADKPIVKVNETEASVTWTKDEVSGKWVGEYLFSEEGDYVVTASFVDVTERAIQTYKQEVRIDRTAPTIEVTPVEKTYYSGSKTFEVKITEHNFDLSKVIPVVTVDNVLSDVSVKDYEALLKADWNSDGDVHTTTVTFTEDADYQWTLDCTDLSGRVAEQYKSAKFVVDNVNPVIEEVVYDNNSSENGKYYKASRTATITITEHNFRAEDVLLVMTTSRELNKEAVEDYAALLKDDKNWMHNGDTHTATITFKEDADYKFTIDYTDISGRTAIQCVSDDSVIDNVDPVIEMIVYDNNSAANGKYYKASRTATITITEHNFDAKDVVAVVTTSREFNKEVIEDYASRLKDNTNWTHNGDTHTATITFKEDADYKFTIDYTDLSGRTATQCVSDDSVIDNVDPVIRVTYDNNDTANGKYYKASRTATITITEHNFRAEDIVAVVTTSRELNQDVIEDYASKLKDDKNWTHNGDVHTTIIEFKEDANYQWTLDCTDLSGRTAQQYVSEEFVIDNVDPVIKTVVYDNEDVANEKYYDASRKATITIIEHNFNAKDIVAVITSTRALDASAIEDYALILKNNDSWTHDEDEHTITIEFKEDANYQWTLDYTDLSGRAAEQYSSEEFVIDNVDPIISVTYDNNNVANGKYYKASRTATVTITERNFRAEDVVAIVTATRELETNGELDDYAALLKAPKNWTNEGDVHTAKITFKEDADYVFKVDYMDLATRVAKQYATEFVVDNVNPIVAVTYDNKNIINTIENRDYLNAQQQATITITEHNFDAKDVDVIVEAVDVTGKDVLVDGGNDTLAKYYSDLFKNPASWTHEGDVHTATIKYSQDANYAFDIKFADLAARSSAEYTKDLFTVDTVAPSNLQVTYSTSVFETAIEATQYGYYNGQMKVTISGEDVTSGINKFLYSYINSIGVSNVNAELLDAIIEKAQITQEGYRFTAMFTIPKEVLSADKQFNGTIEFTAYDVSGNNKEKVENKRIVVDNIKPTVQVTLNNPVKVVNTQSFYADDIQGTIVIQEANFFAQDVEVIVTRDGVSQTVNVKWVDDSVDKHTGTFKLTENGDYFVTFRYSDRSTNQMNEYVSNELTIDKEHPTIRVSNVKVNTANKDKIYNFTISVKDTNFDANTFKPVLSAVVRGEDGQYSAKEISLGSMATVREGEEYSYTVGNLEEDGIYSLVCTVKDHANNEYSRIVLDDGSEYETVRFSINRGGSTFALADENTKDVVEKYYVYSVEKDIVLEEINVDPVETYAVKLNGRILSEGSDYTTKLSGGTNEWSKRTYRINKELFSAEGEYSIVIESTDKANTTAYSDVKDLNVTFVVDQTKPVLTISGLEANGRYQKQEQEVTVIPTDDGGRLNSFKVIVLDSDGNPLIDKNGNDISVRFEMSGEELLQYLADNDGKITFTVPEGLENKVQIICSDCAMNTEGVTNEYNETFEKVTVSQSDLIIFYANKPLFYGSIAGIIVVILGIIYFIVAKKRKKEEE